MPIGDPPTKPADDASEADYEKYRHDFDVYVAEKLAEFADTELHLRQDQKEADEKLKELAEQQDALQIERVKVDTREALVETSEGNLRKNKRNTLIK